MKNKIALGGKALLWQMVVWLLAGFALFFPAGTLSWLSGWLFFTLFFGFVLFLSIWLLAYGPGLLAERLVIVNVAQPVWDRVWILCFYLLSFIWLSLMPLDAVRQHWSEIPLGIKAIGMVLLLCALAGIFVAIRENGYLSPLVRLQRERGQVVVSTGPYAHLRHPLYSSAILFYVGVPLLLGSWYGFACVPLFVGLLYLRAVWEERMLHHSLPGYETYMHTVKYRFIPRIW